MVFREPFAPELTGGCNLRDLGGYGTGDGRTVAHGRLFRSGVLAYLTPQDHARLATIGLRTVIDLRRPDEIEAEPTRWPRPVETIAFPEDPQHGPGQRGAPWERSATRDEARTWMLASYGTMGEWLAPHLRATLRALLDGRTPLLFHCAAGKDRTGFTAGVVLALLGVPEETILADYAFTDRAVDLHAFTRDHRGAALGVTDSDHPIDRLPPDVRTALITADPDYLRAAFAALDERHGGIEGYARAVLHVGPGDIAALRSALLEA